MQLRHATAADVETVIALYVRGWQTTYRGLVPDDFLDALPDHTKSRVYLSMLLTAPREDVQVWLAEEGDDAIGFIAAGYSRDIPDPKVAEIYAVYVDSAAHSKGVGRALFTACRDALKAFGFKRLHVWAFSANTGAHKAYEAWGANPTGETRTVTTGSKHLAETAYAWDL